MSKYREQIEKLNAQAAALILKAQVLQQQADAEERLQNVVAGDTVDFVYGRRENRIVRRGVVLGVLSDAKLRILSGEGVDTEVYTVAGVDIRFVYEGEELTEE